MDYVTLTPDEQADFYRRRLKQAEADHLVHTCDAADQQSVLAVIPTGKAYDEQRTAVQGQVAALTNLASAAEERATSAKAALDAMGAGVLPPDQDTSAGSPIAELTAKVDALCDALVANDVITADAVTAADVAPTA